MAFALVNGIESPTCPVFDRGLQFGDGLFETILCLDGKPQELEAHWSRLLRGCSRLGIPTPEIRAEVEAAIRHHGRARAVAKLIVTRGSSERGYRCPPGLAANWILTLSPAPPPAAEYYERGVSVRMCQTRLPLDPQLAGIKHLNRLWQVLARREWQDQYQEGLVRDASGAVVEACASNVFVVKDCLVYTPDLTQAGVTGVMRQTVMHFCSSHAIPCSIKTLSPEDLHTADEVFLTNSVLGILPIRSIEDQARFAVGPVTRQLLEGLCRGVYFG